MTPLAPQRRQGTNPELLQTLQSQGVSLAEAFDSPLGAWASKTKTSASPPSSGTKFRGCGSTSAAAETTLARLAVRRLGRRAESGATEVLRTADFPQKGATKAPRYSAGASARTGAAPTALWWPQNSSVDGMKGSRNCTQIGCREGREDKGKGASVDDILMQSNELTTKIAPRHQPD